MSDPAARLRLIPGGDARHRRRRAPGPAVILVLVYAVLFAAGLLVTRSRTLNSRAGGSTRAVPAAPPKAEHHSRAELLAGDWIPAALRPRYFARLAAECCTCGCELSLHDCLEGDASCSRSPELAEAVGRSLFR